MLPFLGRGGRSRRCPNVAMTSKLSSLSSSLNLCTLFGLSRMISFLDIDNSAFLHEGIFQFPILLSRATTRIRLPRNYSGLCRFRFYSVQIHSLRSIQRKHHHSILPSS